MRYTIVMLLTRSLATGSASRLLRWSCIGFVTLLTIGALASRDQLITVRQQRADAESIGSNAEKLRQVVMADYATAKDKITEAETLGADVATSKIELVAIRVLILEQSYLSAGRRLAELTVSIDNLIMARQGAIEAEKQKVTVTSPVKKPVVTPAPSGAVTNGDSSYELTTVNGYSIHLAKFNLASGQFRVLTDTGNDSDCLDGCATKSLSSYVSANGAFAGMNGTYFCPVDYASCSGKTGSYYWKVWNSRVSKMINGTNGSFEHEPFLVVNENTTRWYDAWSSFSGAITAGISSSPLLVSGGNNVLNQNNLDDKQRTTKSNRGALGLKGQVLYMVIAKSATVIDLADIMDSLDVDSAMNLDGGGSSAMIFNNSYKIGPGRSIPNAIVVARR